MVGASLITWSQKQKEGHARSALAASASPGASFRSNGTTD
jgi:hypothetical protein